MYIVLETVGIYLNPNVTLSVQATLQASVNGVTWDTLASIVSSVYHGKEDRYVPAQAFLAVFYTQIRLRSFDVMGIREFVPLTN